MKSGEYRENVRRIVKAVLRKRFPGLKSKEVDEATDLIAKNVHARMYGANVDGVDSPLWQTVPPNLPDVDAQTILERE